MDNWKLGVPTLVKEGRSCEPIAAKTRLGWTIQGFYHHTEDSTIDNNLLLHYGHCGCRNDDKLHAALAEFVSIENMGVKVPERSFESHDKKRSKDILKNSTKRINDRFETGLLWKYEDVRLPNSNSYQMAVRRLICLESKMAADPSLAANLMEQMDHYVKQGYAYRGKNWQSKNRVHGTYQCSSLETQISRTKFVWFGTQRRK